MSSTTDYDSFPADTPPASPPLLIPPLGSPICHGRSPILMLRRITEASLPPHPRHRKTYLSTRLIEKFLNDMYVMLDISLCFM